MKIVVLTGAGISAESGISTFRDSNGLWENHRIEEVASMGGFRKNPSLVHQFYNQRRNQLLDKSIKPNAAHYALADLQSKHEVTLVTQNVDNLHERAGSVNVIHIHGELLKTKCTRCFYGNDCTSNTTNNDYCDTCGEIGTIRPDIVWFGEIPYRMGEVYQSLQESDMFVAIGTSGNVYPAAGLVKEVPHNNTLEINLEKSIVGSNFKVGLYGKASETVPQWVKSIC